jgi:hypothetical protein
MDTASDDRQNKSTSKVHLGPLAAGYAGENVDNSTDEPWR